MSRRLAVGLTAAAVGWAALILSAPLALRFDPTIGPASALYVAGSHICHQRPERSFFIAGFQLPVCARCSGLYLSGAAGAVVAWFGRRRGAASPGADRPDGTGRSRTAPAVLVASLPTAGTFALEVLGIMSFSNAARAAAALPLGACCGWVFVRMLRYDSRLDDGENSAR